MDAWALPDYEEVKKFDNVDFPGHNSGHLVLGVASQPVISDAARQPCQKLRVPVGAAGEENAMARAPPGLWATRPYRVVVRIGGCRDQDSDKRGMASSRTLLFSARKQIRRARAGAERLCLSARLPRRAPCLPLGRQRGSLSSFGREADEEGLEPPGWALAFPAPSSPRSLGEQRECGSRPSARRIEEEEG
ncbi:hypothetical protein JRQ81_006728 [Phrynocephalus forsythii]|uniref:Uncharacterized protein n=1 Tax=Phrynocephalus forsythii TaxID=171643 RepID=A0A9Q0Y4T2_9SAUR|nr:hypothetical protein JRQ81_006728 [Phrynocephalus forsythii]